jgi:hypothetical protein
LVSEWGETGEPTAPPKRPHDSTPQLDHSEHSRPPFNESLDPSSSVAPIKNSQTYGSVDRGGGVDADRPLPDCQTNAKKSTGYKKDSSGCSCSPYQSHESVPVQRVGITAVVRFLHHGIPIPWKLDSRVTGATVTGDSRLALRRATWHEQHTTPKNSMCDGYNSPRDFGDPELSQRCRMTNDHSRAPIRLQLEKRGVCNCKSGRRMACRMVRTRIKCRRDQIIMEDNYQLIMVIIALEVT